MKGKILLFLVSVLSGIIMALAMIILSALAGAVVLALVLDPVLAIVDVPFLTERLGGLGFGQLFVLVLIFRLIIWVFFTKHDARTGKAE
jgi:hypothetical protein